MKIWLIILSEWLINISAGWYGLALFEPIASPISGIANLLGLTYKLVNAILTLILAKTLRQWSQQI